MAVPDDETLAAWVARRDAQRESDRQITGTRRAVPLVSGPHRAAHVAPDAPRVLLELGQDGWTTVGVAENAHEAAVFLADGT
ncbi:DUF6087 family protein [Streptomyces spiramyceticus]|uniref:DUF6087 family protein n=1 Tax=Streptomyces spiramyceticus TaxID=299717 RepID=UPI00237C2E4A|nr:DUF6087 family protein [Streptomyces spiramyceticus]